MEKVEVIRIIKKIQDCLPDLESGDAGKVKEAAYLVACILLKNEDELENVSPEFLEIQNLALDLEIPREVVNNYDAKLIKLLGKIKLLGEI